MKILREESPFHQSYQKLSKVIEESKFAIIILSKNYASSTWCLDDLAKIIACKKDMGMTVLPIFHYIDPFDVRKQMGTFAMHLVNMKKRITKRGWRNGEML